jgi:hypothetical protein
MQNLDESRHVRAFEIVRQVHVHVEGGNGMLLAIGAIAQLDGVPNILDADFVDRDTPMVSARLNVFDSGGRCGGHRIPFN